MKLLRTPALAVAVAAALALAGVSGAERAAGSSAAATLPARTVTVSGTGSATAVPNRAAFSFGVTTQARTATQALNANAAEMQRVIAAVKKAGVAPGNVQTSAVSLSPRYSQDGDTILGYTASNMVTAQIRGVGRSGAVIDAAVGAGANQVFGPTFTRSDEALLYRRALRAAVAEARSKARTLAGAGRVGLGRVRSIAESSAGPPPVPLGRAAGEAATPIEPGTQTIQATVTVEFALR